MDKLTLEQLAPYLPYGLEFKSNSCKRNAIWNENGAYSYRNSCFGGLTDMPIRFDTFIRDYKPILRPLSDLTKEIEHKGVKLIPLYGLMSIDRAFNLSFIDTFGYEELKVSVYEMLIEMHFDVFGLIAAGLAIDINTIKK